MVKKSVLIFLAVYAAVLIVVLLSAQSAPRWRQHAWAWSTRTPIQAPTPTPTRQPGIILTEVKRGDPLPTLNTEELAMFQAGKEAFRKQQQLTDGLGPIFNDRSCLNCHNQAGVGGGAAFFETRFGRSAGGVFDPLEELGGPVRQFQSIGFVRPGYFFPVEQIPPEANVVVQRRAIPLFGLGLVDVLPESTFLNLAASQPAAVRGRPNMVFNIREGRVTVSRFGWKGHVPSLFQFSGDAYRNEMGITNPQFPVELCSNAPAGCELVQRCDSVPGVDDDGTDVQLFFRFMRFLAPPPRGPLGPQQTAGEALFNRIGCAACHHPTFTTPNDPSIPQGLRNITFHPYSDFLLHDMGSLGDGTVQGISTPREMRTAPLWGTRYNNPLLHDGRAADVSAAIRAHDGQGRPARDRFFSLSSARQEEIRTFLRSL